MNTQEHYTRRLTRRHPGLFIILLDQSGSMGEMVDGQNSKASFATTAINNLIFEMINKAPIDVKGQRKKYTYLSVLGYNDIVYPLLSTEVADIPSLSENPAGTVPIVRDVYDSFSSSYRRVSEHRPFWIRPDARGKTQMAEAFSRARDISRMWLSQPPEPGQAPRQECFPPVIINITDAQANGRGNPIAITQEIQREGTQQGNTLIFTCHFTTRMSQSYIFPESREEIAHLDPPYAEQMFDMSSTIPAPLRKNAIAELGLNREVGSSARGFVYNADTNVLVKFLHWGTVAAAIE